MSTGILFIARMGSTRLEGKHLIRAGGRSFFEWLIGRFAWQFAEEITEGKVKLVIATSAKPENRKFEELKTTIKSLEVFYGDDANIPKRMSECTEAFGFSHIISVDGDDILCSSEAGRAVYNAFVKDPSIPHIYTKGLPLGMNVAGLERKYLQQSVKNAGQGKA
jgi:spore coat polysaccharide biosynthesis protein SpsF (cytidylyltransferase family)